ncbi:serine hydrolase domain-containing protein [Flavihumibacter fluvii]|uniref:serine hydrolase domain-containing protein n=1 Tax=Flavihumibacter fluvii TaxID=2838157 RepID=UPI001BDEAE01|nr:serine hydrolase domain-containing protein [Flavihumibacter fluvii]ULQ53947.1 beta-lactamase family protein [Flavihumibacter fluvii]
MKFCCILGNFGAAHAQQPEYGKNLEAAYPTVDMIFRDYALHHHFPGTVYGIVVDGKLVHTGYSGMANLEKKIAANGQSVFRIASMSKSFASVAILQLRDKGKLKLDDPAYLYIPELKSQRYPTADAAPFTIRQLLTHAAGFPEDNPWGDRQLAISDEEMLVMFKKGISFSTVPGTSYEYSNMGFAMLGYIIKKVSGISYQEYIRKNIWQPLGMEHTYWEFTDVPESKLALGYRWLNNNWVVQPMEHDGAYGVMGGIITSMEDFAKYVTFMLDAWPPRDAKDDGILKRSSLREMQQPWNFNNLNPNFKYPDGRLCPMVSAYGYGLRWTKDCADRVSIGHSGGLPGFGSNWTILPDYGIGIISFINLTYAPASALNSRALDTLLKIIGIGPRKLPVSPILQQRQKELVKVLPDWKNESLPGIFAENFFLDNLIDSLRKESAMIFKQAGKIIRVGEMKPENNLRGSFILYGEMADIELYFTLSPEMPALIQEYHASLLVKK